MKQLGLILLVLISFCGFAQEAEKQQLLDKRTANNYVYAGNDLLDEDFVAAEMEYRKALSKQKNNVAGAYNLGNSYFEEGNFEEALYRHQQAAKIATSKAERHRAFHNIGNVLMKNKKCKEAVEAYKNALRNDPSDDETRYNLGIAKECAKQDNEDKEDKDNSDDKKDEEKENKDNQNKDNKDNKDGKNEDDKKDEGKDKEDEKEKPEDKKEDKNKGNKEKEDKQKPQPKPGQLSPQQIKSLLEAMNNQEQKVQEKMNAEKQKGIKIKTEKDW